MVGKQETKLANVTVVSFSTDTLYFNYLFMYVRMCVCVCVCVCACTTQPTRIHTHTHTHTEIYAHNFPLHTDTRTHTPPHTYTFISVCRINGQMRLPNMDYCPPRYDVNRWRSMDDMSDRTRDAIDLLDLCATLGQKLNVSGYTTHVRVSPRHTSVLLLSGLYIHKTRGF